MGAWAQVGKNRKHFGVMGREKRGHFEGQPGGGWRGCDGGGAGAVFTGLVQLISVLDESSV